MKILRTWKHCICIPLIMLLAGWQVGQPLRAAVVYWDINGNVAGASGSGQATGTWDGANTFWSDAAGTSASALWNAGDIAVFSAGGNATNAFTVTVSGTQQIGGLTFEEGLVTLSGDTLQMVANSDFSVASGLTATIGSVIDGGFDFNKVGAGTLVLGGINTYTGKTLINAGTLSVAADANLGAAPGSLIADSINFTGGGTLQFTGTGNPTLSSNRGITLDAGVTGTVQVLASANTVTYGGVIAGITGTTFKKSGAGTLDLQGVSSLAGALNIDGGVLRLSGAGTLAGTSGVILGNRGTFTLDNATTNLGDRTAGAFTSAGGTLNFISNAAATTETLGALTLNAGALTINSTAGAGGSTLTIPTLTRSVAGGTLYLNNAASSSVVLGTAPALVNSILKYAVVNNGSLTSFASYVTSAGTNQTVVPLALASHAQGAETTWNANTVNARPTVTVPSAAGAARTLYTLTLDSGVDITAPTTADRTITFTGGVLQTGGTSTVLSTTTLETIFAFGTNEALFHVLGTLQLNRGNTNTLTGTAGLTKSGAGTLILNGVSTLTIAAAGSAININEGVLELRGTTALMTTATTANLNGAMLRLSNDASTSFTGNWVVNADSAIQVDRVTAAATATTHTVSSLTIGGGRTLSVSSNDITSGTAYGFTATAFTLTAGGATIDVANNGAGTGTMTVGSSSGAFTLTKTGAGDLVSSSTIAGFSGPVDIQAGRVGWSGASGTVAESQTFMGAGGVIKSGSGTVNLTGISTFTGGITVTAGTLGFSTVSDNGGSASSLGQGTNGISVVTGTMSFIGGSSQSTNRAMTVTGGTTASTSGLTLDASGTGGAVITYNGAIDAGTTPSHVSLSGNATSSGVINGVITQSGTTADLNMNSGTWTLGASNAIGDDIIVNGGTLILNAVNVHQGDDLFIRTGGTVRLGVNGALSASGVDDLLISDSGASGGAILDLNGKTSSVNDTTIGLNPANQPTAAAISGSIVDTATGGLLTATTINLRNGTISANVAATAQVTLGNVISADTGGLNATAGTISGALALNAGSSLVLLSGTISGPITFASGITLAKHSTNSVTLSGDNVVTGAGASTLSAGTLILDHTTNAGAKISAAGFNFNGGTLQINGHATTAVVVSAGNLTLGTTTDPAGASVVINTAGAAATLQVGTITRNAGSTLRFNPSTSSGHLTTSSTNTAGSILGGWATYRLGTGPAQFATVSGGEILGLTSTVIDNVASWTAGADVTDSTGFSGSTASLSINSLRFDAASGSSNVAVNSGSFLGISSGGILVTSNVITGSPSLSGGTLVTGASEVIVTQDSGVAFTLGSLITGAQSVSKAGNGVLILNQSANNFSGAVRVSAGTLRLQGGGAVGDAAAVVLDGVSGVLLDVVDSETIGALSGGDANNMRAMGINIANGKTLTINQGATGTYFGQISAASGSAILTKTGGSTLTLTDSFINLGAAGVFNISGGRVTLDVNGNNNQVTQITAGTTVNIGVGASLFIDHNDISAGGVAAGRVADNTAINLNSTGSTTDGLYYRHNQDGGITEIVGAVTFASGVNSVRVDSGSGASANAVLRAATISRDNQSTLVIRGTNIHKTATPRAQFQNAAVFAGFGTGTGTSQPILPWAVGASAGGTAAPDSFITTAGTANAQWRPLDLATEYAAVTTGATWTSAASTNNVLLSATVAGAASAKTIRSLVISTGTAAVDLTGDGAGTLTVDSGGFLFSGTTGTSTISGFTGIGVNASVNEYIFHAITASATVVSPLNTAGAKITKSGAGILILSGDNTALGATSVTTLNEGVLQIADLDNIGGGAGGLVFAGGTLQLGSSFNVVTDDITTRTITYLVGGGTIDTNGLNATFAGSIGTGSGTFTKAGAGNLTLGAATTLTGGTTVAAGTLTLGANQAIGTGSLSVTAAATLDMGVFNASVANVTLPNSATVALTGSGTLTVSGTMTVSRALISPVLAGTMNLIKQTASQTATLGNVNTFTGFTHVQNGTLSIGKLANAGSSSSIGAATGDNAAIRLGNAATTGILLYTGSGDSTNRAFWLQGGAGGGGTIDNDGTGALTLNGDIVSMESGAKTLTLQGASTGFDNTLNGVIGQYAGTVALTKAEAGTWVLANTAAPSTYTGINTITAGTLQVNRATGGLGESTAVNAINLNGGILSLRNNGAGSNGSITYGSASNPSGYNVQLSATSTLNVDNLTANTGNSIVLGPLTQASAAARTLNVTGANGYTLTLASLGLNPGTGQTTTLIPTTSSLIIAGNVINPMSGFGAGNFDTLVLDGTSTGNVIGGSIADAAGGSIVLGGTTRLTKSNTSTWTLNGASTYTGATTVNGGVLLVNNTTGSGTGASAVTVNGGTTAQGLLGGTGIITGTVTLATNGATSFAQGATLNPGAVGTAGTLTLNTGGLTTANFSKLNFDISSAATVGGGINDLLSTNVLPIIGATTQVSINTLGTLTLGSLYTLIDGYSGTITNPGNLQLNPVFTGVDTLRTGILQNNSGMLQLLIVNPTPSSAYWAGALDGSWNTLGSGATTNWHTDATGGSNTFALPGAITDVFFYTTIPAAANLSTTLGQNFTIKTLNFTADADSAMVIAGNTLTITPGSSSTGISIDSGAAGAVTISSNVTLGAAQTWTNNSTTSLLTIAGNVTGAFGLTVAGAGNVTISGTVPTGITSLAKTGAGTLYLSGANGFTGTTTISGGGVVKIDAESGLGAVANDVTFGTGGGTLQVTSGFTANSGKVISVQSGPGTIQVDSGTLVIGSAIVGTSAATANGGGLIKTGAGTLALTVSSSAYDAQGVGVNGATGVGFRVDAGTLLLQGTSTSVVGDINPNSMAVQLNGGALTIQTDTASIARANVYVTGASATITVDRATSGTSITQAIGTGTGAGLTMGVGSSVLNIAGGNNITTGGTGAAVSFTGSALLLGNSTLNITNASGGGALTLTLGALNDSGTARTITKNGNGTLTLATAATSLVNGTIIDINAGTVNSNLAAALGTLAAVDVADGATLNIGASQQIGSLSNDGSTLNSGIVNMTGAFTLTIGNATNNLSSTFTGKITGASGALTKSGNGILTLGGLSSVAASNYGGLTTLSAGTLRFASGDVALAGGLTLGTASTTTSVALDLDGVSASFGPLVVQTTSDAVISTVEIDAGKSLTINGNATIGAAAASITRFAATGGGTMTVTNAAAGANFTVGGANTGNKTVADFSGLGGLTINLNTTDGLVRINPVGGTNTTDKFSTLILASQTGSTNSITAKSLIIGDSSTFNSATGQINSLILGSGTATTNVINVDTISIGNGGRDLGQILFNGAGGSLTIRGAAGGTSRAAFDMATAGGGTATFNADVFNLFDVTGHTADLRFGAVNIGAQSRNQNSNNVFSFDAGTLDMTSLTMATRTGGTGGSAVALTNATLNLGGTGSVIIGSGSGTAVTLASATAATTANATINLTGSSSTTINGNVVRGGGAGTTSAVINLQGSASLDMSGFSIGSAANLIAFNVESGTLRNLGQLNGGADLVKTTGGTLTIGGVNTYTGNNVFEGGLVIADGGASNRLNQTALILGSGSSSAVLQLGNANGASNQTFTTISVNGTSTTSAIVGGSSSFSTLTLNQGSNVIFDGNIGGTGTHQNNLHVVKSGAGTLVIAGTAGAGAAWVGTTLVSGGDLYIDHKDAFAATSTSLTVADGAEFAIRGSGLTANQVYGFSGTGNKITLGSGAGTAVLGFRVDGAYNTQLKLLTGQTMSVAAGSTFQTAVYVDDAPTAGFGYILIDGADAGSLHAGGGSFDFNPVIFNGGSFTYALSNVTLGGTVDRWVLTPTAQPAFGDVWWRGDLSGLAQGVWSASLVGPDTNWDTQQASVGAADAQVPPDSGSIVHFSSDAAANFATTLGANMTIQELVFHSGGTAISIDGNSGLYTLTLGNTVDASGLTLLAGAPNVSITADVVLAQAQSFNIAGAATTLTFGRGLGGIGALGINDNGSSSGTMILGGVNGIATYTGATNLVTGRLILQGGADNRLPTATVLTMGSATLGATLQLGDAINGASNAIIGTLITGASANTIVGGGSTASTLTIVQGSNQTFNGVIGGAGTNENQVALVKQGSGTLVLAGANTYVGSTTINQGLLQLGASASINGSAGLFIIASAGTTATFDNNGRTTVLTGGITLGGGDTTAEPIITSSTGGGQITLGGNVLYDATNNPLGASIPVVLNLGSATRTFTANNSTTAAVDLTIAGAVSSTAGSVGANGIGMIIDGTGAGLLTGAVALANGTTDGTAADFTKNGTGAWTIQNTVSIGDNYIVNAGTFTVSTGGSLTWNATGSGDPDFVADTTAAPVVNFNVVNSIVGNAATNRIFARDGSTINLNITNAIGASIEQIILGDNDQGIGNLVLAAGTTNSVGRLDVGNDSSGEIGNVTGTGTLVVSTNLNLNNGTVSANLSGAAATVKNSTLTVLLNGSNSLTGSTTIQEGTLTADYATYAGTNNKLGTGDFTIGSATHNELRGVLNLIGSGTTASRQDVANFAVAGGPAQINLTGTAGVDNILRITGTLTRSAGTVNFSLANASTKLEYSGATALINGMLPAWMILNRANFLTISENGAVDNLVAVTYTSQNNAALWSANQNITNSAAFTGTVDADCNTINSLRFNATAASTITVASGNSLIISSGGIMATAAVGNNASTITGGRLVSGTNEFFFHQNNTSNILTVSSMIFGGAAITKTGDGVLLLSGINNQTGAVVIEEGRIRLSGGSAISDTSSVTIRSNAGSATTGLELAANQTETIGTLTANTGSSSIVLNTGSLLTIIQGSNQTMAGVISGAGSLIKTGSGTLTLSGASTLTGTLRVDQGQITLNGGTILQLANATAIVLNGSGTLSSTQDQTTAQNRINNNATVTLSNTAAGSGFATIYSALTASGTESVAALTLGAGHNIITSTSGTAFAGSTTFASLIARNNRATALVRGTALGDSAIATRGQIIFTSGPGGGVGTTVGGAVGTTKNLIIIPYFVGDVSASGLGNSFVTNTGTTNGLRPLAAAEYDLNVTALTSGNNTRYTVATTVATVAPINSLVLDGATGFNLTGPASSLEITSGAILSAQSVSNTIQTFAEITTGGGRDYTIYVTSATGTLVVSSALSSAVSLVKSGAGTLSLTAAGTGNQFTDLYMNQGVVLADDLDRLGTGVLRFFGGGIRLAAGFVDDLSTKTWDINTGDGTIDVSLVTAGTVFANGIDDSTVSAGDTLNIFTRGTGAAGVVGQLIIQGASTYTGTLIIRNSGINSGVLNGVVLNGTTNAAINGNLEIGNVININDNFDAVVALGANEQIVDTASITFRGVSGENAYFKLMGFTETVAGISDTTREGVIENVESTESGVTSNGKLIVNSSSDFSYNAYMRNRNSGSNAFLLEFEKQGSGTQTLSGDRITYTGTTTITGGTLQLTDATAFAAASNIVNNANLTINRTTGTQTFNNVISGTGTVTKLGSGTVTLGGTSSYSGQTNIEQGVLSIGASSNLGDGSSTNDIRIANQATLQVTASLDLGANRTLTLSGTGGRVEVAGTSTLTVSGVVEGDECCGLIKEGTGNMVLSNASNTWAGSTSVSAGILQVGSAGTGSTGTGEIAVASGATLAGSGVVRGSVILNNGAVLQAGDVTTVGTAATTVTNNATLTFTAAATSLTVNNGGQIKLGVTTADSIDGGFATWFHANGGTAQQYVDNVAGGINNTTWNSTPAGNHDFITAGGTLVLGTSAGTDKRIAVSLNSATGLTYGSILNLLDWGTLGTKDSTSLSDMSGAGAFDVLANLQLEALSGGYAWDTSLFNSYGILVVVPEPSRALLLLLGLLGVMFRRRRR